MRKNKYNAKKIKADGYTFDSQAEYNRYCSLKLLEKNGWIEGLKVHTRWPLDCKRVIHDRENKVPCVLISSIGYYESDFDYFDNKTGSLVVEDVKGVSTDLFKWKWKHAKAQYPDVEWIIIKAR